MTQPNFPPSNLPPASGQPPGAPIYYGGGDPYSGGMPMDSGPLQSLNPMRLLQIARNHWVILLLAILFAGGAAAFYLSRATEIYQAEARIELSTRRPRIVNKQDAMIEDRGYGDAEEILNTQIQKFNSPSILPFVVASYRELYPDDPAPEEELTARLANRGRFAIIKRTRLVSVTFTDPDPEFAMRACAAYAAGAEAAARAENRSGSNAAVAWLEAQALAQRQELEKADQELFDARQTLQMDVLAGRRKTIEESLLHFNESLSEVEAKASMEQKMLDALSEGKLPAEIPGAADVAASLDRWRQAMTERDALLSRYTPEHPAVEAQDKAVALYKEQANQALNRAKNTAAANLALYQEQAGSLQKKNEELLETASKLDRDILEGEMRITALNRTRSAADASYLGLLTRIQEARLSADENTATVKLASEVAPARQIFPRPARVLLMALLLGLAVGFGLAILTEILEDRVGGIDDIEIGTGVKILAVLPHVKTRKRKEIATTSLTHQFGELAEAFAGLRSVLDSPLYRDHSQIVLVASSLPEEGKTTTSCNLATACALNGQKTLLIDFDLRRPRVGNIFPRPEAVCGLLEYLDSDQMKPEEIVYASECRNLSVISSRVVGRSRPAELVGGAKVAALLAWARAHFDRIVLDVPPLGIVSDALSLAHLSDCVLVMARPATSRKRAVRHTIQRFQAAGMANLAVVMNDVEHSKFTYHSYGPYYHYQKHYGAYAQAVPPSLTPTGK
ncbi:MAG TPA: hypothetical protein DCM68_02610 [Verrucomicrobia bacterium]|nr:hypothetical protein [Verrucomicrobiota bacterium]